MKKSCSVLAYLFFGLILFLVLPSISHNGHSLFSVSAAIAPVSNLSVTTTCNDATGTVTDHPFVHLSWSPSPDFDPSIHRYIVYRYDPGDPLVRGDREITTTSTDDWATLYSVWYYRYQVFVANISTGERSPIVEGSIYTPPCTRPYIFMPFNIRPNTFSPGSYVYAYCEVTSLAPYRGYPLLSVPFYTTPGANYYEIYRTANGAAPILIWQGSNSNLPGYLYGLLPTNSYWVGPLLAGQTFNVYVDNSQALQTGQLYSYQIISYNTNNGTDWHNHPNISINPGNVIDDSGANVYLTNYSGYKFAPNCSAPNQPTVTVTRNTCTAGRPDLELSWPAQGGNVVYFLERQSSTTGIGLGYTQAGGLRDTPPLSNTTYTYHIQAYDTSTGFDNNVYVPVTTATCIGSNDPHAYLGRNICVSGAPNIEIDWVAEPGFTYYVVRDDPDGQQRGLGSTTGGGIADAPASPLLSNNWYTYEVRAVNNSTGLVSDPSFVPVNTYNCAPPNAYLQRNICLNGFPNIEIDWTALGGNFSYYVARYDPGNSQPAGLGATTGGGVVDSPPLSNTTYRYQVVSYDSSRNSTSAPASVTVLTGNCAYPGAFTLNSVTPSCSGTTPLMTLSWSNSSSASQYIVHKYTGQGTPIEDFGPYFTNVSPFTDVHNITYGSSYIYQIEADGNGTTFSNEVSVTATADCAAPVTRFTINGSSAPPQIQSGNTATFSWNGQHANSCTATNSFTQAFWYGSLCSTFASCGAGATTNQILTSPPRRPSFTVTCTNGNNGLSDSRTVNIDIGTISCLKTTGGDVHSNQSITAPAQCN